MSWLLWIAPSLWGGEPQETITLQPQRELAEDSRNGRATIVLGSDKVTVGDAFTLDVRYDSRRLCTVYNPFFHPLVEPPAALAIFDQEKQYLGDLTLRDAGSYRPPSFLEWVQVGERAYAGCTLKFVAGHVPNSPFNRAETRLPPGKYYLQMIYRHWFATSPPARAANGTQIDPDALMHWRRSGVKLDLFRSNIVEIELLSPK
jgi:hypothetical protein